MIDDHAIKQKLFEAAKTTWNESRDDLITGQLWTRKEIAQTFNKFADFRHSLKSKLTIEEQYYLFSSADKTVPSYDQLRACLKAMNINS